MVLFIPQEGLIFFFPFDWIVMVFLLVLYWLISNHFFQVLAQHLLFVRYCGIISKIGMIVVWYGICWQMYIQGLKWSMMHFMFLVRWMNLTTKFRFQHITVLCTTWGIQTWYGVCMMRLQPTGFHSVNTRTAFLLMLCASREDCRRR